ncbi:hypothetical protein [Nocardia sp. NPDC005998]|uniref:hypothetical protein n=1 Tax=Nocardia sp. NPDC005998 TaxID=3156894 RepID=UPI0033A77632
MSRGRSNFDRVLETDGVLTSIYENLIVVAAADEQSPLLEHESAALAERRYIDRTLAKDLAELLSETRRLEDQVGSKLVLPLGVRQTRVASALAVEARRTARTDMVDVAAGANYRAGQQPFDESTSEPVVPDRVTRSRS